jgi:hypothetical protein
MSDRSQQSFADIIKIGLSSDPALAGLQPLVREKIAALAAFIGDAAVSHAYKTLKSWPTHFPASSPKLDFQLAIDAAVSYIERWMQAKPNVSDSTAA